MDPGVRLRGPGMTKNSARHSGRAARRDPESIEARPCEQPCALCYHPSRPGTTSKMHKASTPPRHTLCALTRSRPLMPGHSTSPRSADAAAPSAPTPPTADAQRASIARRLAAMVYETLLVVGLLMVSAFLYRGAATHTLEGASQWLFRLYLAAITAAYFIWCWHKGSTLAMKAWRLRLIQADGDAPGVTRAAARFVLAALSVGAAPLGLIGLWHSTHPIVSGCAVAAGVLSILWALVDRDGQFLHDRLAGTRLMRLARKA